MSLIKCHECGQQVSTQAKACPSCGAKPKRPTRWKRMIVYTFGFLILLSLLPQIFQDNSTPEQRAKNEERRAARLAGEAKQEAEEKAIADEKTCSNDVTAFVMTQGFVEKKLKSPATAKFPSITDENVKTKYLGDCTHEVLAYVDSQNSFGALIRTRYYVKLQNVKGTDDWIASKIMLDE